MPTISVREALDAIEVARSQLSPEAHAALTAIGQALVALTYEIEDAKRDTDDLQSRLDTLEAAIAE